MSQVEMMFDIGGVSMRAVSIGGFETCIEIPSWKLGFDIGRCPHTACRLPRILFTHAHVDHLGGVVHHCATRDLLHMSPPQYFLPAENVDDFRGMLDAWRKLDGSELLCSITPVRPGDRIDLGGGRTAAAFRAPHRVPALGYAVVSSRRRLRSDLVGAPKERILEARARGETVDERWENVDLAFCGDTLIEVVEREELVRKARVLVLEVTFLDDRVSVELARGKGHVHLDEVIERADLFENEAILFTHFSARYSRDEIQRILDQRLPERLKTKVIPLLPPGAVFGEWGSSDG